MKQHHFFAKMEERKQDDVPAIVFLINTFNSLAQPVLRFRLLRSVSGASGNCRIHLSTKAIFHQFLGRRCPRIFGPICRWLRRKNAHLANHDCRWKGEIGRWLFVRVKKRFFSRFLGHAPQNPEQYENPKPKTSTFARRLPTVPCPNL